VRENLVADIKMILKLVFMYINKLIVHWNELIGRDYTACLS